jgi:hypothetical protein
MRREVQRTSQAIHPALAPAALGLLAVGAALDLLAMGRGGALAWLAFWAIAGGVAFGMWCATFALLDWIFFAELGHKGMCGLDGLATTVIVGLFGLAVFLRIGTVAHAPPATAMALEVAAMALLGTRAWIGRELAAWLDERR